MFILLWFCECNPGLLICATHRMSISALSSSVLTTTQHMLSELSHSYKSNKSNCLVARFAYWIYPCFIIWGLDRLTRILRLVVFNFRRKSDSMMDATTELLSDDFVRLRFHRPSHFHWAPGQTAYLIMPSVSRLPFEAHPFTIASFDSDLFSVLEEQKPQSEKPTQTSLAERSLGSSAPFWKEVVFFINVRKGFTARLKEAALKGDKVKVLLDGPYGPSPNMGSYDTCVLIAGELLKYFVNIAHECPTFRWIRCLVHATSAIGYNRVCQAHCRSCILNLFLFQKCTQRQKQLSPCCFYLVNQERR
jgi:hypothetical protein